MNATFVFNKLVSGQRNIIVKHKQKHAKQIFSEIERLCALAETASQNAEVVAQIKTRLYEMKHTI